MVYEGLINSGWGFLDIDSGDAKTILRLYARMVNRLAPKTGPAEQIKRGYIDDIL